MFRAKIKKIKFMLHNFKYLKLMTIKHKITHAIIQYVKYIMQF